MPAGLITRLQPSCTEVVISSENENNPYQTGTLYNLDTGSYCETVAARRKPLLVANAFEDLAGNRSPDLNLNMVSYLGLPLQWPDGEVFGTLCVLDSKTNHFNAGYQQLLEEFKAVIEEDLRKIAVTESADASKVTDITELKRTEKALRESEATARTLLNTPSILTLLLDPEGFILDTNKTMAARFGKNREELIGLCLWDLLSPEISESRKTHILKTLTTGKIQHWEDHRAGAWFSTTAEPIFDENGAINKAAIVAYDITERIRAQESLQKSEQKYRELVNEAATIILRWDINGNVTFFNEYAQSFFGFIQEEIVGKNVVGTIVPETEFTGRDLALLMVEICRDPAKFENNENENMKRNGERVWIAWKNRPLYDQTGKLVEIHSVGIDITARKRAEDALRESEALWRSLTENSADHIMTLDENLKIQFINFTSPGLTKKDIIGKPIYMFVKADRQNEVKKILETALKTGKPNRYETQYHPPDGDTIYYESLVAPRLLSGKVTGLTVNARNITERKHIEEALRRARDELETRVRKRTAELVKINTQLKNEIIERQLAEQTLDEERRLFISGPTVVFKWRAAEGWPVEYVSPNVASQLGYAPEDFTTGKIMFADIIHPEDLPRVSTNVQLHNKSGVQHFEQEYRLAHRNGQYLWLYDLTVVIRNNTGEVTHYHGYVIDITDRKRAEEEMQNSRSHFQCLDRISRALTAAPDLNAMLWDMLAEILEIFSADRAWLLYPCDPQAAFWQVPFEVTRAGYEGAFSDGLKIPNTPEFAALFEEALASSNAITHDFFRWDNPPEITRIYKIRTQLTIVVHPKIDKPWMLGIQQCSYDREWTNEDKRLFRDIGIRVGGALTSRLLQQQLEQDIAQRKRIEAIEKGRSKVLELLAMGAPIEEVLHKLVTNAEESNPGMLCSILLVDYDRRHLRLGAAPSLPDFYNQAIDGIEIGPDVGSCGTAAFLGKSVIVEDTTTHPLWKNFRDLAAKAGIRACWSEPVLSSHGQVLGTFAIYYRESKTPEAADMEFIKNSARLAGIAIERRHSEEQAALHHTELAHMSRLNVMGEMATGIAHELNQPLTAIANFASAARKMVSLETMQYDKVVSVLDSVQVQAQRASEIIHRLRKFVKKQSLQKSSVDLNMLVNDVVGFLETETKNNNVQIKLQLASGLPIVFVDAIHIEQVLINLIRNALEAMVQANSQTRVITIRTQVNEGDIPLVEIADTGPGIDKNTSRQIFEPFVTTKGTKGMGMGLSISRSIVEAHGGQLWVESEPGKGARFFLTVPVRAD